jgi:hypothetical protein
MALFLLAVGLAACSSGSSGTPRAAVTVTTRAVPCDQPQPATAAASWLPADLPLPAGTYTAADRTQPGAATHQAVLVVPLGLRDFVRFAVTEWPKRGWRAGRGDSEAREADDAFTKPGATAAFKAAATYCDVTKTQVLLTYAPTGA